jgi:hypothetical protein
MKTWRDWLKAAASGHNRCGTTPRKGSAFTFSFVNNPCHPEPVEGHVILSLSKDMSS